MSDVRPTIEYLEVDNYVSVYKILQRIEHFFFEYVNDSFELKKYRMKREFAVWDCLGRLRINALSRMISELNEFKSHDHSRIVKVMNFIYLRLKSNPHIHTMSNRELYYALLENTKLFSAQNEADKLVFVISSLLRVPRIRMGLAAAARGTICGRCSITYDQRTIYHGSPNLYNIDGANISDFRLIQWHIRVEIKYVIIIEKDAILDQLRHNEWIKDHCILITGRGYPPLLCRKFIHLLSIQYPHLPIFCFVDCDAHGLDIFLAYQHGTINSPESYHYAIPSLLFLGVEWKDLNEFGVRDECKLKPNKTDTNKLNRLEPFLRRKMELYFKRHRIDRNGIQMAVFQRIWNQLMIQKDRRMKVEIEGIIQNSNVKTDYIRIKIDEMIKYYGRFNRDMKTKHLALHPQHIQPKSFGLSNNQKRSFVDEDRDFVMRDRSDSVQTQY